MRHSLRFRIGLAAAALFALGAAACGSEPTPAPVPAPQPPPPPATSVPAPQPAASATTPVVAASPPNAKVASDVENFVLEELVVAVGTEVTWTNRDTSTHTSTSGSQGSSTGIWDSPVLAKGASYSFTFDEVGTFNYFCRIHPRSMNSTIKVVPIEELASARALAAPPPTPESPTPTPVTLTPAPIAPTATAVPPTATAVPPTATSVPPTATAVPPTATSVPSTATAIPPTATAAPTAPPMPTATSAPTPEPVGSNIINFALQNLTVQLGTTVTWKNQDTVSHTTTAGTSPSRSGEWDSSILQKGQSFSFTFTEVGTFPYFCTVHPSTMIATVTIVEAGAEPVGGQTATPPPNSTPIASGGADY